MGDTSSSATPTPFGPRRARGELADVYKSAYEEGRRLVDAQAAELDAMRVRSLAFLAFTGAATAFLAGTSLDSPDKSGVAFYLLAIPATLLWVAALLSCLSILLAPKTPLEIWAQRKTKAGPDRTSYWWAMTWRFGVSPQAMARLANPGREKPKQPGSADVFQELAIDYEKMRDHNKDLLSVIRTRYACFLTVACIQLSLWVTLVWLVGTRGSTA